MYSRTGESLAVKLSIEFLRVSLIAAFGLTSAEVEAAVLIETLFALLIINFPPTSAASTPASSSLSIKEAKVSVSVTVTFLDSPSMSNERMPAFLSVVPPHGVSNALNNVSSVAVFLVVTVVYVFNSPA